MPLCLCLWAVLLSPVLVAIWPNSKVRRVAGCVFSVEQQDYGPCKTVLTWDVGCWLRVLSSTPASWDLQLRWSVIKSWEFLVYCCISSEENDRENSAFLGNYHCLQRGKCEYRLVCKYCSNISNFQLKERERSINKLIVSVLPTTSAALGVLISREVD